MENAGEGIVYWVRTWTEEREEKMFLLDHNGKIQELSMPQQLPVAGTHFYDVICATEKGMYFWYLKDFESMVFRTMSTGRHTRSGRI